MFEMSKYFITDLKRDMDSYPDRALAERVQILINSYFEVCDEAEDLEEELESFRERMMAAIYKMES